jgi:protein-tyrosine sulfotransferase
MTRPAGERLVFVGGSPRSGTTLLQNMLDSHPDVAGGPEFDHVAGIMQLRNLLDESVVNGRIAAFRPPVDAAIGRLLEDLLLPYADSRSKRLLSEKTPSNVLVFADLLDVLPACHCIFVVRDPRAVVSSMLQVGRRARERGVVNAPEHTKSVALAIETVRRYNAAGFAVVGHPRVLMVRYELLTRNPEAESRRITNFLGLDWDARMLSPEAAQHDGEKLVDEVWYTMDMYRRAVEPAAASQWQSTLRGRDRRLVEAAFSADPQLAACDYNFDSSLMAGLALKPVMMMARARALGRFAGRRARRILRGELEP